MMAAWCKPPGLIKYIKDNSKNQGCLLVMDSKVQDVVPAKSD